MKNRTALRDYFLTNRIPKQEDFHELIDSGLNQAEDGVRRAANGPLELEAQGAAGEMLHLYGSFRDSAALWKIGHKPALAGAAGASGLNIADAQASRLFIKAGDGSVGIGTDAPAKTLDVVGAIGLRNNVAWDHLFLHHDGATAFMTAGGAESGLALRVGNATTGSYDAANQNYKEAMRLLPSGNVGIGIANPQATLQVARGTGPYGTAVFAGTDRMSHFNYSTAEDTYIRGGKPTSNVYLNDNGGNVGIGTTAPNSRLSISPNAVEAKITLWDGGSPNSHYGFGISDSQLNYHVDGTGARHVFYAGGKNGTGTELLRIQGNGNVGIGTSSPTAKLDVNGDMFIGGRKPIIIKRFLNLRDNVYYNTGYSSTTYAAAITGMNAKGGDINEGAADASSIINCQMYIQQGTWWIRADFKTHAANGGENWDIDVLFIDRRMADLVDFSEGPTR